MKQIFKSFAVSAAIAVGITACSNEEIVPDQQPSIERASMTIVINNNSAATKAGEDTNAVEAETKINSISLFVYGAATKAEADTTFATTGTGGIEKGTDANVYKVTFNNAPIGSKKIYVGVNLPAELYKLIKENGVKAISAMSKADLGKLSPAGGGFPMFSDDSATDLWTIKQGETNSVTVSVKRLVAKVTLETTGAFEKNENKERTVDGVKISEDLDFAMGQMNTKFFPYPQKINGVYQDPNYFAVISGDKLSYQDDFVNEFYDFKTDWTSSTSGVFDNFKKVSKAASTGNISDFKPGYVLENTNALKKEGELTFAFVKAKFTPEYTHDYEPATGVKATQNTENKNNYSKLYVFNNGGTFYYFQDKAKADAYKTNSGIAYTTYTDCICFYMVYLGKDAENHNVLRNDYIKMQIEKVVRLGDPHQGPNDPTGEKGGKAAIQVTMTVQPWKMQTQSAVLGE
ncbi:MAG: Mfa1 family fimbria major subunit [Tannerellaceae bacterium]|nr:Mfa1 family fimbria major subunit [Tannerellaceae bacterium]